MWGTFIASGDLGYVFNANEPDQVIKVMGLDDTYDSDYVINKMQYQLFTQLQEDQKQGNFTPGLPQTDYVFTTTVTPELVQQIWKNTDLNDQKSKKAYQSFKQNLPYGSPVGIILMEKISVPNQDVGRKGLSAMLRYLVSKGWAARDLRVFNKGLNPAGDIIWFDPMVAPLNPRTEEDLKMWDLIFEDSLENYQQAIANNKYFSHEHDFGLFNSEGESFDYWLRGGCGRAAQKISEELTKVGIDHHFEIGLAYLDQKFVGNHIIVVADNKDLDYYGVGGAKDRWQDMIISEWGYEEIPDFLLSDYLVFEWIPVKNDTFSVEIKGDYLPAAGNLITPKTLGFNSEVLTMRPEKIIVINTRNNKVVDLILWNYYADGNKSYQKIPLPKPISKTNNPDLVKTFYQSLGVATKQYDLDRRIFSSESYPRCYLCGLPAKIEVLTAVGMRNFCGNKCRGHYEGIDYGDYDSPKLEHQLTITNYDQGYLPDQYDGRESKLTIDCANCPLHLVEDIPQYTDLYSEYRSGHNHTIKTWNEEWEDYEEEPCINHDLVITRYLSNSESYDGVRLGEIAFRCRKCGYRDMIYADIPEGCPNTGRAKPTLALFPINRNTE
jgi:hypothetical protein